MFKFVAYKFTLNSIYYIHGKYEKSFKPEEDGNMLERINYDDNIV